MAVSEIYTCPLCWVLLAEWNTLISAEYCGFQGAALLFASWYVQLQPHPAPPSLLALLARHHHHHQSAALRPQHRRSDANVRVLSDETHTVAMGTGCYDIAPLVCRACFARLGASAPLLGWRYTRAHDVTQRSKEGLYVLELALVATEVRGARAAER